MPDASAGGSHPGPHSSAHPPAASPTRTELLAPAGQPDAGYAALHYGADAVYLGLPAFSARAEAMNFTPGELGEFVAYAHSLPRPRRVYLTLNTLVRQDEVNAAADTMLVAEERGVDAVILQDYGMVKLVRERFPSLAMHASTQMAIHNLEGVLAAADLGFRRVTLARELTLGELAHIAAHAPIEVESFIHGTLCYSYSGLCFFSSFAAGRSGNRGRCVYSCREAAETPFGRRHPFSLKDLSLGERARDLARAGLTSLKIEGRKKSPLYVAATVDYYRRILDGVMHPEDRAATEGRLRTVFARPWTRLFLDGPVNPDAADTEVVGHRGAPFGTIDRLMRTPAGPGILFQPGQALERHDGIQVDIPGEPKPYGFPVDHLYQVHGNTVEAVYAVDAGTAAAVALPADAPALRPGMTIYHASSQAVKRAYPFDRPKGADCGVARAMDVAVAVTRDAHKDGMCIIKVVAAGALPAHLHDVSGPGVVEEAAFSVPCFPARDREGAESTARSAFARTGGSMWGLGKWSFANPDGLFCKPGDWNGIRRKILHRLDRAAEKAAAVHGETVKAGLREMPHYTGISGTSPAWNLIVPSPQILSAFTRADLDAAAEVTVEIGAGDGVPLLRELEDRIGRERIRLALPLLMRFGSGSALSAVAESLVDGGWRRWLLSNPGAVHVLAGRPDLDRTADWLLPVTNSLAIREILHQGFSSCILSPENDAATLRDILSTGMGDVAGVVVHVDPPLFISAACAHAHLGACPGTPGRNGLCRHPKTLRAAMERSGTVFIHPRTCGSVVTGARPFSLADRTAELRDMGATRFWVDLRWGSITPGDAVAVWRRTRKGDPGDHGKGNFTRTLM